MATVITHAIVAAGLYRLVAGPNDGSRLGIVAAGALAVLPDADVVGWSRLPRDSLLWHRGLTHSFAWAAASGALAAWALRRRVRHHGGAGWLAVNLAACTATHGLLDAFTDGGDGVAFLSPFDRARTHFDATPIPVAPISANPLHPRTLDCLAVEAMLLWPVAALMATAHRAVPWWGRALLVAAVVGSAVVWVRRA